MKPGYKIIYPDPILSNFIECYWIQEKINVSQIMNSSSIKVIPTNSIEINFYSRNSMLEINGGKQLPLPSSTITGQKSVYKEYAGTNEMDVFIVRFKPWGAFPFIELPLYELMDQNLELSDVIINQGDGLFDDLIFEPSKTERFVENLEKLLFSRIKNERIDYLIIDAVNTIHKEKGLLRIADLSKKYNMSQRHFERRFKAAIGTNPKNFIQIVKLHYLINLKKSGLSWYDAGHLTNYYDYSHLSRSIKNITGLLPSDFFSNININETIKHFNSPEFLSSNYNTVYY